MKVTTSIGFVLAASLFLLSLDNIMGQGATTSETPSPATTNRTCRGKFGHHNRVSRSQPPNTMEDKLKDFATKLGKTPDDLRAAFGKFMLAQGISVQQMHEEIEHVHQAALQMVDSIKKAMQA